MIDNERTMAEVHALAEQARETLGEMPPKPAQAGRDNIVGVIAPIHMGTTGLIPERYVVHFTISQCKNCGTESRYNEFFALTYLRSRVNGTRVRHLTRCDRPEYNLPVDRIPVGTRGIPFCCECSSIDLSHLPPPPSAASLVDLPDVVAKGRRDTVVSKRQPKAPEPKAPEPKAPAKPATLDDLI